MYLWKPEFDRQTFFLVMDDYFDYLMWSFEREKKKIVEEFRRKGLNFLEESTYLKFEARLRKRKLMNSD